ncbi:hypothetical protein G6F68_013699 [Rhizopus microsporus]|nr:hypothetical protein G6F68_013699 [Rhizopus microsporus]
MSYLLPLWYILSDIALWNSDSDQLVVRTTTSTHARAVICELFLSSGQSDATIRFDWYIKVSQDPPSVPVSITAHFDTWPSQLSHWCCSPVPYKQVPVASISPREVRRSCHPIQAGSCRRLLPPYRMASRLHLSVSFWKGY